MSNILNGGWLSRPGFGVLLVVFAISVVSCAQQGKQPSQVRANDFPSIKGYDPGHPIPYDPNDPYVALKYVNDQFDGQWNDIDAGALDVSKYFSLAPQAEDYTDPNRENPTPNTPKLTPEAAEIYKKIRPMILSGNNPAQAVGWCYLSHPPTTTMWNQFSFTPDSMNASLGGGGGNIYSHVYMDGRPHPDKVIPAEQGHAIGHWEGDTLVIDTVGFKADRDFEIGLLNSDQQHVVTRIRRLQPDLLEWQFTVTDSKVLAEPWTIKRRYRRGSMEVDMLRDVQHCLVNANQPDPESEGGNQLRSPEGKQLQLVPKE